MSLVSRIYASTAPEAHDIKLSRKACRKIAKRQLQRLRSELKIKSAACPVDNTPDAPANSKVTQAFTREQRICESQDEDSPRSPGLGPLVGIQGNRPSTENVVSAADPRTGMTLRAGEAR